MVTSNGSSSSSSVSGGTAVARRAPMRGDPACNGRELQMADFRYHPDAAPSELTGGLYRDSHVQIRNARLRELD